MGATGAAARQLTPQEWSTPTRCSGWDVAALLAHVCPDPAMFDRLNAAIVDAEQAVADAESLTPAAAATRFTECARILRATPMSAETVIGYPTVGSTTVAVIAEAALMEAAVHMLDLADAVVEVLAGRAAPETAVPAIR